MRPFAGSQRGESTHDREPEATALLVLSTATDRPRQWLLAGEVASAALLAATSDGLASSQGTLPMRVHGPFPPTPGAQHPGGEHSASPRVRPTRGPGNDH